MNTERHLDARMARRLAAEDRYLDRLARRTAEAEPMVGELIREGKAISYINQRNLKGALTGKTVEFADHGDAVNYLLRNNYV